MKQLRLIPVESFGPGPIKEGRVVDPVRPGPFVLTTCDAGPTLNEQGYLSQCRTSVIIGTRFRIGHETSEAHMQAAHRRARSEALHHVYGGIREALGKIEREAFFHGRTDLPEIAALRDVIAEIDEHLR